MRKYDILILSLLLTSCQPEIENAQVDYYVDDVSSTAPVLLTGQLNGEKVDYVVSSYPVIEKVLENENKKTTLTIKSSIREEYSKKYKTDGFPQAGLFIRSDLDDEGILNFLYGFDKKLEDLKEGAEEAGATLARNHPNEEEQTNTFGFDSNLLLNCQKENRLAFTTFESMPKREDFEKFSSSLQIDIDDNSFSKYYSIKGEKKDTDTKYSIISPLGAPSALLVDENFYSHTEVATPALVQAAFQKKEMDFIIFDSVNGEKLSKKNGDSYKLVRMVTMGNLYLVSTGNDEDDEVDNEDVIVSYGENLIPDLAFKAVYGE